MSDVSPEAGRVVHGLHDRGAFSIELVDDDGEVIARYVPAPDGATETRARPAEPVRLHSTTVLRTRDGCPELLGARTGHRVVVTSVWALSIVTQLFASATVQREDDDVRRFLELLSDARLLVEEGVADDATADWELHDALFHAGSRFDTRSGGFGATYPVDRSARRVNIPRPRGHVRVPLPEGAATSRGLTLQEAARTRASSRDHDGDPIGTAELGVLLDCALRVRRSVIADGVEIAERGVPTGGGLSGLSAVLLVNRASDLATGVYEYDAVSHELVEAGPPGPAVAQWIALATRLTGISPRTLQVLVLLTLDYWRPARKYEAIVYATALKECGAVMQSMALTSADLGLSLCPLGGGLATTRGLGQEARSGAVVCELAIGRPATEHRGEPVRP